MRDPGVIDALDALERYARAFDEISREQNAHYSARSFVRWGGWRRRCPPENGEILGTQYRSRTMRPSATPQEGDPQWLVISGNSALTPLKSEPR